jgi:hypothetical protein
MKCAKCGKPAESLKEVLWDRGPNGFRRYKVCDRCAVEIAKSNALVKEKEVKK